MDSVFVPCFAVHYEVCNNIVCYAGIENLILPMLSYPGCHERAIHGLY